MSEFGHIAANVKGFGFIDTWGEGPFVIHFGKRKSWRFEDSDRFGPQLLKDSGELRAKPVPSQNNPFWLAHRKWVEQGRQLEADGITCRWYLSPPKADQ